MVLTTNYSDQGDDIVKEDGATIFRSQETINNLKDLYNEYDLHQQTRHKNFREDKIDLNTTQ